MIELRGGRCDRHGRLPVARLLAEWGADASLGDIMHEQIGSCPHRNGTQLYCICDPYSQHSWSCSAGMSGVEKRPLFGGVIWPLDAPCSRGDAGYWGSGSHISSKQNKRRFAPSKQKKQEFDGSYAAMVFI